jgi:hypothetical protein
MLVVAARHEIISALVIFSIFFLSILVYTLVCDRIDEEKKIIKERTSFLTLIYTEEEKKNHIEKSVIPYGKSFFSSLINISEREKRTVRFSFNFSIVTIFIKIRSKRKVLLLLSRIDLSLRK